MAKAGRPCNLLSLPLSSLQHHGISADLPSPARSWRAAARRMHVVSALSVSLSKEKRRYLAERLQEFPLFREAAPGVKKQLAQIVEQVFCPKGSVLITEGDPPGDCYLVLSGELGIIQKQKVDQPEVNVKVKYAIDEDASVWRETSSAHDDTSAQVQPPTEEELELAEIRKLGTLVSTMGHGSLVGEYALMHDHHRDASVRCMQDCELLVIKRHDFLRIVKEDLDRCLDEKKEFLREHLPGVRDISSHGHHAHTPRGPGRVNASYFFHKEDFKKGHVFLRQGQHAESAVYVVFKGSVDFYCSVAPKNQALSVFERPLPPLNKLVLPEPISLYGRHSPQDAKSSGSNGAAQGQRASTLFPGGVFGTVDAAGLQGATEPFTAIVSSSHCEVFVASGENIVKLPHSLQESVHEYLSQVAALRLESVRRRNDAIGEHSRSTSMPQLPSVQLQLDPASVIRKNPQKNSRASHNQRRANRLGMTSLNFAGRFVVNGV